MLKNSPIKQMKQDIKSLIAQLDKLEHLQDNKLIDEIAKRYGIKRLQ